MRFAKYHGIGNDFVMLADPGDDLQLAPELVRRLCDRRFGIGADGVIRVGPGSPGSDFFMDYFNSDGSIGEMCGNGIRCLAVFARAEGLTRKAELRIDTRAGVRTVWVDGERVTVDMGPPIFEPFRIPVAWNGPHALHAKVEPDGRVFEVACLSMGNPHAVVFLEGDVEDVIDLGPLIERNEMFPKGANVEFVEVVSPERLKAWVWERGAGRTLACGTGACAAAVAGRLLAGVEPRATVELPGGELEIDWEGSLEVAAPVFMSGPATKSFEGEVDLGAYV